MMPESDSDLGKKIEIQERTLGYQLDWIKAVDTKTEILIAIDLAMLGLLAAVAPKPTDLSALPIIMLSASALPLLVSLFYCVRATFPHLDGPRGSLIYFGGICAHDREGFGDLARGRSETDHLKDLCDQTHQNALIAGTKYKRIQAAFMAMFIGAAFWLPTVYILYQVYSSKEQS